MSRRILAVAFPRWCAECARRSARRRGVPVPADAAVLVLGERSGARLVVDCCRAAADLGVRRGMALVHARAICDGPRLELPHEPEREASMLRACALWCQRISPVTMIEPSAGMAAVLIDITGCERIHPPEPALESRLRAALKVRGFTARTAVAPTCAAAVALAAARRAPGIPRTVEECPVRALRLDRATIERMHEVNIRRIGELARCTRGSITARFGAGTLLRLDQAFAHAVEFHEPLRERPLPCAEIAFDGPVAALDAVQQATQALVERVCEQLAAAARGAREVELSAACADAPRWSRRLTFGAPSARARHMLAMLAPAVERMRAGIGVELLRLRVLRMGRMVQQEAVGEWVDTLSARLGDEAVLRCALVEDHRPARSLRWLPVLRHGFDMRSTARSVRVRVVQSWRPSRILDPAEPAAVVLGEGGSVLWRGVHHAVRHWHGPERIASPWGGKAAGGAGDGGDYWRAQTDAGGWLWLRRCRDGWSVAGRWC